MISNSMDNNSDIQGYFTFNSERYSVNDLVTALLSQGISIHKVGTNLKVGQKTLNPIINNTLNYSNNVDDPINQNVIQGLTSQIQRIFNELNKLKDHLGINYNIPQDLYSTGKQIFDISSFSDKKVVTSDFDKNDKWDNFILNKNFDLKPENKFEMQNNTPIITLGRKKNSSLIDEYTDLVTNKGIPDNDALDRMSSRLFNTANNSLNNLENKLDIRTSLATQSNEKSSAATTEYSPFSFTKCDHCNSKIPGEAQFCSKCGKKR